MALFLPNEEALSPELRELVRESGAILGKVIEREAGRAAFQSVERLRASMADLREKNPDETVKRLRDEFRRLEKLDGETRRIVAKAFTFFLELMNACENAYRTHRLRLHPRHAPERGPRSLVYVLTAHPTEARAPANIAIFHGAQEILVRAISGHAPGWRADLRHQLELAWRAYPTRQRAPRVKDEAEHIYRTSLRPEILRTLLAASQEIAPLYLRTWVGGDKDGHPGVDETAMSESLNLARATLLRFVEDSLASVERSLDLLPGTPLRRETVRLRRHFAKIREVKAGDGARVAKAKRELARFAGLYTETLGALHPALRDLKRLVHGLPGLVVPLEFREASDVLMAPPTKKPLAIARMLNALARISRGGEPTWYVRGFIVSMTDKLEHLLRANALVEEAFGRPALPVIPLFETVPSLEAGPTVVREAFRHRSFGAHVRKAWGNRFEIMVGYSDSSKQGGAFPSRLAIAGAMHALEAVCREAKVEPVFFQGSGGSVDRGGGSVQDQVSWWPRAALETYKVTIQGEMVERSFSSPEIARGQLGRVAESIGQALAKPPRPPSAKVLFRFADAVRTAYQEMIHRQDFLRIVDRATPYAHLAELKIGSRPTRRTKEVSVEGLRAIPWVLCWTQTRVLFQTWWGVGRAWRDLSEAERKELRRAFAEEPVFTSYVKALGFTIAKVELPLWRIYLDQSDLPKEEQEKFYRLFGEELAGAYEMVQYLSGEENPLWFRPWLAASIRLRAPMIHPLNLLQVLAIRDGDVGLFRTTAIGISAGMMTTG